MTFLCKYCKNFSSRFYSKLLKHIAYEHQFEPDFRIKCHLCLKVYTVVSSYRSHLYRKHGLNVNDEDGNSASESHTPSTDDVPCNDETTQQPTTHSTIDRATTDSQRTAALFILKAKEERMLTQNALSGLLKDVTTLMQQHNDYIIHEVKGALVQADITTTTELDELFDVLSTVDPFAGLETEYLQTKYYKENFRLLEPTERLLGQTILPNSSGIHEMKRHYCYDVPFLTSLQLLLGNTEIQKQVLNSHKHPLHIMRDYCDGNHFSRHPMYREDNRALQIQLYYDDIDVCNPIGSKSGIHKLGMFYYTLTNIDPTLRSRLHAIMLLAVANSQVINTYGIDEILKPFVEEMMELESVDGIPFDIDGQIVYLRGTLTSVVADNPASNLIGGFKNLSSALRKCRHCLATAEETQTKFTAEEYTPRTKAAHEHHCYNIHGEVATIASTTYGVTRNSILNTLQYFHVTSGLPPDIMHDIFEGVAVVELHCMLLALIQNEKLFNLSTLNNRIRNFPYGIPDAKNKPLLLPSTYLTKSSTEALKQSSAQTWCLLRLLPLIIGDLIPEANPYWVNFLRLLELVDYVCAHETTTAIAGHLRDVIKDHHICFKLLYPDRRLTPKFHHLIHLPKWITEHGPLSRMWSMRYEAKHRYFKRWAGIMGNFKNIPKTLAAHHQRYMCYKLLQANYLTTPASTGPAAICNLESISYKSILCQHLNLTTDSTDSPVIHKVNWMEINGVTYKPTCIVLLRYEDDMPVFGHIVDIFSFQNNYYLATEVYTTCTFNQHYHAYEVKPTSTMQICEVKSLKDYHPLWVYQSYSQRFLNTYFIPLKYYVLSDMD